MIHNPWAAKTHQYKGQLHCHTTNSDGVDSPANLMTAYKNAGYDFCSISDHDYLTPNPNVSGILYIPGIEETTNGGHILNTNATENLVGTSTQSVIDSILKNSSLSTLCHPAATPGWTNDEIVSLNRYNSMDIFIWGRNTEAQYDYAISNNRRCWATAADDCHDISNTTTDFNLSWVVVNADELTLSAIVSSLNAGNFYASRGADISNIELDGRTVTITVPATSNIKWIKRNGVEIKTTASVLSDTYNITGDEGYVRIEVTNVSTELEAWSQPIFIDRTFRLPATY